PAIPFSSGSVRFVPATKRFSPPRSSSPRLSDTRAKERTRGNRGCRLLRHRSRVYLLLEAGALPAEVCHHNLHAPPTRRSSPAGNRRATAPVPGTRLGGGRRPYRQRQNRHGTDLLRSRSLLSVPARKKRQ